MKLIVAVASATLLGLAVHPAAAQSYTDEPASVQVSYADLDLSRAAGRTVLEQRIKAAIDRVCPAYQPIDPLGRQHVAKACRASALSSAQQQVAAIFDHRELAQSAVQVTGPRR